MRRDGWHRAAGRGAAGGGGKLRPPPAPPSSDSNSVCSLCGFLSVCRRRQRQFINLGNRVPTVAPDTWVAPNAVVVGDVDLYERVSAVTWVQSGCKLDGAGCVASCVDACPLHT